MQHISRPPLAVFSFRASEAQIREFDKIVRQAGRKRSAVIQSMIEESLDRARGGLPLLRAS